MANMRGAYEGLCVTDEEQYSTEIIVIIIDKNNCKCIGFSKLTQCRFNLRLMSVMLAQP